MRTYRRKVQVPNWAIPISYAVVAVIAGLTLPRIEAHWLPESTHGLRPFAAGVIYSAISSGVMAFTGVVFSLVFVMVQFSAIAYSPRLVSWIVRDRVLWNSLGVFTATFIYSLSALAWLDRNRTGNVPLFSGWLVIVLMLASVVMLVALIDRISLFQIQRMLTLTGDFGRGAIETLYPALNVQIAIATAEELDQYPITQTVFHRGRPRAIQGVNEPALFKQASTAGGIVELISVPGDFVVEGTPLLRVYGNSQSLDEKALRGSFQMGEERTFEQDPQYAIRLLVDIAIRALSPAVNDPYTAVQALDQIEDLLRRLGSRRLETGAIRDAQGKLRLAVPRPSWEDFLNLAFEEIRLYGATSVQVMRRMNLLIASLISALPRERHEPMRRYKQRLEESITITFPNKFDREQALAVRK